MDSIAAMNKKSVQKVLDDRARTQKSINRTPTATNNHSQCLDGTEKGISVTGPTRTNRERVEYSPVSTHVVHLNRPSVIAPGGTLPQATFVGTESKWAPPLPDLETALGGPSFPWIPALDARLRHKMTFRMLAEYNDLRDEALKSLNPRPQCIRKLYILVKKYYHQSG
ncbi:hypothetical protein BG015_003257 [Linnemannia schmuckeri]|uniref:Uncharacterized protein n=1 Tax=Linnemannia schmuckeri TaxID=64567 RepID=A0A9P5VD81_9FUNG|nr:hypothetical protein BG015_003257 [Linnemannia schmuckeri]